MNQQIIRFIAAVMIIVFLGACATRTIYFTPEKHKAVEAQSSIDVETVDKEMFKVFNPGLTEYKLVFHLEASKAYTSDRMNVLPDSIRTDGSYHVMPAQSGPVELRFASPFTQPGLERTIILKASGWYDPHFDVTGEPQTETADRILNEPGYSVCWAVEYWRKNGVSHEC